MAWQAVKAKEALHESLENPEIRCILAAAEAAAVSRILADQVDPVAEVPAELFYKLAQTVQLILAAAVVAVELTMVRTNIKAAVGAAPAL